MRASTSLRGQHLNGALEEIAEQQRFDGEPADERRGNRQQNQRHGHHPGALVQMLRV